MLKYETLLKKTHAYLAVAHDAIVGNLSHSYLFVSADSIVRENLCTLILAAIFCKQNNRPCLNCPDCRKITNNTHSDIHYYKGKTNVEKVSEIIELSALKAYSGNLKVFVIESLHEMNAAAQNKLLKTLEEPPEGVIFLMFASDAAMVLPTVLSRSQIFYVENFAEADVIEALQNEFKTSDVLSVGIAAGLGGGKLESAQKFIVDDEYKAMYNLVFDIIGNMQKSPDILTYFKRVERHKARLKEFLEVFYIAIRDILIYKTVGAEFVLCKDRINDIMSAAMQTEFKAYSRILDLIVSLQKRLFFNGNYVSIIDELLFSYLEVKALCR